MVDLHLHSTASDGEATPSEVAQCAARVGLSAIALTDHDTMTGIAEAAAGAEVRVVAGCEFSVRAWWGELHLLGYFLPADNAELTRLFQEQRTHRAERAAEIVSRLTGLGVPLSLESVRCQAGDAPVGRPHVARAMVKSGIVGSLTEAFDRYLADDGPAFVPKHLPPIESVVSMVRGLGGVTSAAHLKNRATRDTLRRLQRLGVDAVEVRHPSHNEGTSARLESWAVELGMLKTGGSDWHGDTGSAQRRPLGSPGVPEQWLSDLEQLHLRRTDG